MDKVPEKLVRWHQLQGWPWLEGKSASSLWRLRQSLESAIARNEPVPHWKQGTFSKSLTEHGCFS